MAPLSRKLSGLGAKWFGGNKGSDSSSILTMMTDTDTLAEDGGCICTTSPSRFTQEVRGVPGR